MRWVSDDMHGGVRERRFVLPVADRIVPGLLWTGEHPGTDRPLVLVGHGGSGHKRQGYVLALARHLVRHHDVAVAAIDGPVHGDRRSDGGHDERLVLLEFAQAWRTDTSMTDAMVEDWRATLQRLRAAAGVGTGPVGYWGLSMGTIVGLPFVAAEPSVSVAVLGLMGLTGPTRERLAADAALVRCPVLFLVQQSDELFDRESSLALFDALGTGQKILHLNPGAHGMVPDRELRDTEVFLVDHLA